MVVRNNTSLLYGNCTDREDKANFTLYVTHLPYNYSEVDMEKVYGHSIDDAIEQIPDALEWAYELQSTYKEANIEILLFKGMHTIIRSNRTIYQALNYTRNGKYGYITIRPLLCSDLPDQGIHN